MSVKWISVELIFLGVGLAAFIAPALAGEAGDDKAENIVISASLLGGVRSDLLTSSASLLSPSDLEYRQVQIVSDVLRDVPGVAVNRQGPEGQFTQVRIRGAEANHTLVMIDGIKASDPFYGEFDFATLIADDVAKIEVLRGEQSALYGSDAIGGVISYITATGAQAPGFRVRAEGGSFGSFGGTARFAGASGILDYAVSGAFQRTQGTPDSPLATRSIGAETKTASGKFSVAFTENFRVKAVGRYAQTEAGQNSQDFAYPPGPTYGLATDGNGHYVNTALYGLIGAEYEGLDGHWRNALTLQGVDAQRDGFGNNFSPSNMRTSGDKGERVKATYVTSFDFGTEMIEHKLTGSLDWEREYYQNTDPTGFADTSRRNNDNYGYVAQYDFVYDRHLAFNASGRIDDNYRFDKVFTYHVGASYLFDGGFRPHAAAGTGIKAPTVYELYSYSPGPFGFISNPNLKPEKSKGWEVGAEQMIGEGMAVIGATYFHSTLEDEIVTVYPPPTYAAQPQNATTQSTREGVETSIGLRFDRWRADAAFTHIESTENGLPEVRRPENMASLNVAWRAMADKYGANLTIRYNGPQKDFRFTPVGSTRVDLASYTIVNMGADYHLNDMWQIYGRVENLFDKKYEEVFSFLSAGRGIYAGVRATFP